MRLLERLRGRLESLKEALDWPRQVLQAMYDVLYDCNYRIKVMQDRIDQLEARIDELEAWRLERS